MATQTQAQAPSVVPLRPAQLRTLLSKFIPAKLPLLISGAPGVGKSDIVATACAEAGVDCIVSHPVVSDPTDFKGMPWVADGRATFLPFGELEQLISATKPTAFFLDDLGQAPASVQAAAMQLILARRINGHKVSPHVVFLAATNRRTDKAGVTGILEPVKSRFVSLVELVASLDDWRPWAASAGIAPEIRAFLNLRPALLSAFKPSADMVNSPSPRAWHNLSRALAVDLPRDLELPTVQGAIGPEAAVEFVGFRRVWESMVSPDVVLTSPHTAPIPAEPSTLYAVVTAIALRVQRDSVGRYMQYLERVHDAGRPEFSAVSLKTLSARDDNAKLAATAGYIDAMAGKLGKLLIGGAS